MKYAVVISIWMLISLISIHPSMETIEPVQPTGMIDLSGDWLPETIHYKQNQIDIIDNGIKIWETPPEWKIVDWVLGDPDGDGRNELILAFWKKDKTGIYRSHPFIIGFRGGIYRTVWGGSAVIDPILKIALEDLDGDGTQELLVLEQHKVTHNRYITVWRWHGWGFKLIWRSPPGSYTSRNLKNLKLKYNLDILY